ncbi:MAG: hypothetical protein SGI71_03630 [Verrucomicrobiota bacterium]|nr:hypothetical protein [Verrucomicrobiota bacterium]
MKKHIIFGLLLNSGLTFIAFGQEPALPATPEAGEVAKVVNIKVGDNEADARRALGKPVGMIATGDNEKVLSYERGDLTVKDGKVIKVDFLPNNKTWKGVADNKKKAVEQRQLIDKQGAQAPLRTLLVSGDYAKLTTEQKIGKLEQLKKDYPEVDVAADIEKLKNPDEEPAPEVKPKDNPSAATPAT